MTGKKGKMYKIRQVVRGQYVATPIKNAFNDKVSYWFSKEGCTIALYMFTVGNGDTEKDFEERISEEGFREMIPRFEELCRRPFNAAIYDEQSQILEPKTMIDTKESGKK